MTCEVLVSTMNKEQPLKVAEELAIKKFVIINQITNNNVVKPNDILDSNKKVLSFYEKGLSRSRNKALKNSSEDICIIADDDMYYVDNYEQIIIDTHKKYPSADIIAFVVDNDNPLRKKKILKQGRIGYIKSMKLQSVQITFKRENIIKNNISFDEDFGAGSTYSWGEENIFLFDCLRKKLNIYYVPIKIATLKNTDSSTWDRTNNQNHYEQQGAIYYRMSKILFLPLVLQFIFRKKKIYKKDMSEKEIFIAMINGKRKYQKSLKDISEEKNEE